MAKLQHQQQRRYKPMLCSSSSHDQVKLPSSPRRLSTSSSSSSEEPLSPRVGCMGQVKMKNYNVVGFPAPTNGEHQNSSSSSSGSNSYDNTSTSMIKYLNLRFKGFFFSGKSLTNCPTAAIRAAAGAGPHKAKIDGVRNTNINHHPRSRDSHGARIVLCRCKIDTSKASNNHKGCLVNLKELDPPLPVVKRVPRQQQEEQNLSLWNRRSGGAPLKSLQIHQVIHKQLQAHLQPTTVSV